MTRVTRADARKNFEVIIDQAQLEPMHIQENGRDIAVILSPAEYQRLIQANADPKVRPRLKELLEESMVRWDAVYRALADKPE